MHASAVRGAAFPYQLTMDGVITQVARDGSAPVGGNSSSSAAPSSAGVNGSSATTCAHDEASKGAGSSDARRAGGLLASFLCCGCNKNDGTCKKEDAQRSDSSATAPHVGHGVPASNGSCGGVDGQQNAKAFAAPLSTIGLPSSCGEFLIGEARCEDRDKKCVVIDLDETLVHSSFNPVPNADFVIPVEIDGVVHQVYVLKRPFVDQFLSRMGELFECVLFTASLAKYADPVADLLDRTGCFRYRLFREACVYHKGNYVKDLSRIGREVCNTVIIDNSPASYIFHPDNAVPVGSWFDDPNDTELLELIPFFEGLTQVENCVDVLKQSYS